MCSSMDCDESRKQSASPWRDLVAVMALMLITMSIAMLMAGSERIRECSYHLSLHLPPDVSKTVDVAVKKWNSY